MSEEGMIASRAESHTISDTYRRSRPRSSPPQATKLWHYEPARGGCGFAMFIGREGQSSPRKGALVFPRRCRTTLYSVVRNLTPRTTCTLIELISMRSAGSRESGLSHVLLKRHLRQTAGLRLAFHPVLRGTCSITSIYRLKALVVRLTTDGGCLDFRPFGHVDHLDASCLVEEHDVSPSPASFAPRETRLPSIGDSLSVARKSAIACVGR